MADCSGSRRVGSIREGERGFVSVSVLEKRGGRGAGGFLKDIHCAFSISSL